MNIFVLDQDVIKCAQYHCDKHVVKMILETAQLLSTAHHVLDGDNAVDGIYRKTHYNHPCAIWVRETNNNYNWTWCLLYELCKEYTFRYSKTHKTELERLQILKSLPENITIGHLTPHSMCMPDQYKTSSATESYRNYYRGEKASLCTWKKRETPAWF